MFKQEWEVNKLSPKTLGFIFYSSNIHFESFARVSGAFSIQSRVDAE